MASQRVVQMNRLDDAVLRDHIFQFVGKGHFRTVAGTCKRFWELYSEVDVHTSASELVQTLWGVKLFYSEANRESVFELPAALWKVAITSPIFFPDGIKPQDPLQFVSYVASWKGRLEVVQWAHTRKSFALNVLSWRSWSDVVQWAQDRTVSLNGRGTLLLAAYSGKIRLVQWARSQGFPWDTDTIAVAARGGHLDVVDWIRLNGCPWDSDTCMYAAAYGHLHVLQWARAHGCPWGVDTCMNAAASGYLGVLIWARANGCPWDVATSCWAAYRGRLSVLQWARAHGCPWDSLVCTYAAMGGRLSVLRWAHENGCPWNAASVILAAQENGHHHVEWWAIENR